MPIFTNPQDGSGEQELDNVYYNPQDGSGEQQIDRIYVNAQDGNGEQVVWQRQQWVVNFDGKGGLVDFSNRDTDATESTAAAHDGTYGLEQPGFGSNISYPGDGLPAYPGPGDEFEVWVRFNVIGSGDYLSVGFAVQGSGTMLRLSFDESRGSIAGEEIHPNGNNTLFDSFNDGYSGFGGTTWWKAEPRWYSDDTLRVALYDDTETEVYRSSRVSFSYTNTWARDGIQFRGGGGSTTHFDSMLITEPDSY